MSRIYAFEREPYRRQLEVEVIAADEDDGRPFAFLNNTILYPEGGGQPADLGFLYRDRRRPLIIPPQVFPRPHCVDGTHRAPRDRPARRHLLGIKLDRAIS